MFDFSKFYYRLLPMSQAAFLMRKLAIDGLRFYQFSAQDHLLLWVVATIYLSTGILIFRLFEKHAMTAGTLGQY
jgi:ABC-2 type transport system permease protein